MRGDRTHFQAARMAHEPVPLSGRRLGRILSAEADVTAKCHIKSFLEFVSRESATKSTQQRGQTKKRFSTLCAVNSRSNRHVGAKLPGGAKSRSVTRDRRSLDSFAPPKDRPRCPEACPAVVPNLSPGTAPGQLRLDTLTASL